jgi:hypothetical protein
VDVNSEERAMAMAVDDRNNWEGIEVKSLVFGWTSWSLGWGWGKLLEFILFSLVLWTTDMRGQAQWWKSPTLAASLSRLCLVLFIYLFIHYSYATYLDHGDTHSPFPSTAFSATSMSMMISLLVCDLVRS